MFLPVFFFSFFFFPDVKKKAGLENVFFNISVGGGGQGTDNPIYIHSMGFYVMFFLVSFPPQMMTGT